MRQLDVGEAVDQRLAEVGELVQERLVLLLDHLVLLLDGLEAGLHGGDLETHRPRACNTSRPQRGASGATRGRSLCAQIQRFPCEGLDAEGVTSCALSPHTRALGNWTLTAGLSEKELVHEGGLGSQAVSAFTQFLKGLLATVHRRSCEDWPCATQAFLLA